MNRQSEEERDDLKSEQSEINPWDLLETARRYRNHGQQDRAAKLYARLVEILHAEERPADKDAR
ncbi:MAG TPA: hypothetical protein V6D17_20670 [Candidatus Obscuribacterales bacterium]